MNADDINSANRTITQTYRQISAAFDRLADGLSEPADASAAGRAARDLGALFSSIAQICATADAENALYGAIPDEFVMDDDGPRAGILRPVEPTDYAPDSFGRSVGDRHYGCPTGPICVSPPDQCRALLRLGAIPLGAAVRDVDADHHGRLPGADHYGCTDLPCPGTAGTDHTREVF